MKIPEGWKLVPVEPTPEMHAARYAIPMDEKSPKAEWEAMLEASPTPSNLVCKESLHTDPAQEGPLVGCSDGFGTRIAQEVPLQKQIEAAPTPPAQEDEPVYLVFDSYGHGWRFSHKTEYDKAAEEDRTLLYPRPDNSELRKAAEEFIDYFNNPEAPVERSLEEVMTFLQTYEDKLRNALKGKS